MMAHAATHGADMPAGTDAGAHRALVEQIDERVRERVRAAGVDPQHEPAAVRRLAEEAVRLHDERSLTGQVVRVADPSRVVTEVVARVSGFGELQPYLEDDEVEEIWINKPSEVFVSRRGRHELTSTVLTRAEVNELIERMLKSSGRRGPTRNRENVYAKLVAAGAAG